MIHKISGKRQSTALKHLSTSHTKITAKKNVAYIFAETSKNSSSKNNQQFIKIKQNAEKVKLQFKSNNSEAYNKQFTLLERMDSIKNSNSTAVGPDEIHYKFLKQLPKETIMYLLKVYNNIWTSNKFPNTWREMAIVAIPKNRKDSTNPDNYHPITLTSCLCMAMECMISNRHMVPRIKQTNHRPLTWIP